MIWFANKLFEKRFISKEAHDYVMEVDETRFNKCSKLASIVCNVIATHPAVRFHEFICVLQSNLPTSSTAIKLSKELQSAGMHSTIRV